MGKGHDFHKDKDVGEIVKPWANKGKYACVFFPCLTQPLSLKITAGG